MKYSFKFSKYVASWSDIEAFFNKDKSLPIRCAPKLTERHVHPNNFAKMKVKLATQILSHTVAASICTYVSLGVLPQSAMGTAEFISQFDSLFDSVNSSTLSSAKDLRRPITAKSNHVQFLNKTISFIKSLKAYEGVRCNREDQMSQRVACVLECNSFNLGGPKAEPQFQVLVHTKIEHRPTRNFFWYNSTAGRKFL